MRTISTSTMFDEIETIADLTRDDGRESVGFNAAGRLVHCDGRTTKRVTLKESAAIFARLWQTYSDHPSFEWLGGCEAPAKWGRMVAATLR